jgi:hypothetical protein
MEKFNVEILNQIIKLFYGFENEQSSWYLFLEKRIILNRSRGKVSYYTRRNRLEKDFEENGFSVFNEHEMELISIKLAFIILQEVKGKKGIERIPSVIKKINIYMWKNMHNENFNISEMISEISASISGTSPLLEAPQH